MSKKAEQKLSKFDKKLKNINKNDTNQSETIKSDKSKLIEPLSTTNSQKDNKIIVNKKNTSQLDEKLQISTQSIKKNQTGTKDNKNAKNSKKTTKMEQIHTNQDKNLMNKVQSHFSDENKVGSSNYVINGESVTVFYIESLVDKNMLSSALLLPLEKLAKEASLSSASSSNSTKQNETESVIDFLKENVVALSSLEETSESSVVEEKILSGSAVIVSKSAGLICPLFSPEKRSITEPPNSKVVKGPREGFVEDIAVNEGLIRKRLQTKDLKIVELFVGRRSNSKVSIYYLEGIAKPEVVETVKKRINQIDIDAIIDSYYIESFLETDKIKFFRRVGNTEKPDIFCAKILEGRVGILVDGSPVALTVPFMVFEDLQSAEDYYSIPAMATFARAIRIIGLIFALIAPGVYVALQSYNYRILPINFLITLLSSIEGLSIPPLVEILIVLFLFEIITEASLRMPNSLGMALSIIGALALGNTAVDAGIISPPSIVVVAVSSVALYIIPDQISQTRIIRMLFTAIGGIVGLYGIVTAFIILTTYLCSITSFGVPYMSPYAPSVPEDKKDGFIKHSVNDMKTRPKLISDKNKVRQKEDNYDR